MRGTLMITCMTLATVVVVFPATAAEPSAQGYIYGTVTTRAGSSYTGFLRWGGEEAFWDDIFHSGKQDLPYIEYGAKEREETSSGERWWEVFGKRFMVIGEGDKPSRIFSVRFGDIREIEVLGRDKAELTLKDGATVEVRGYANDVGATVAIEDAGVGQVEVEWSRIKTVTFQPVPQGAKAKATRLYGTVATDDGDFTGFIQWDSQECLSTDILDGDSEDGRLEIAMGKIRSIERRSRRSSQVELLDGRTLVLDGTNDVNSSIRGILIEDPRFGRVEVSWDTFRKLELREPPGSGSSYDSFPAPTVLRGTVTDSEGVAHTGPLAFDLDETWSWEMLNGARRDIEYSIPFDRVQSIEPKGASGSKVVLRNGEVLELEEGQDVSERNDGVLILAKEAGEPTYVPWRLVKTVRFDW